MMGPVLTKGENETWREAAIRQAAMAHNIRARAEAHEAFSRQLILRTTELESERAKIASVLSEVIREMRKWTFLDEDEAALLGRVEALHSDLVSMSK
jgi:hypothetical protein